MIRRTHANYFVVGPSPLEQLHTPRVAILNGHQRRISVLFLMEKEISEYLLLLYSNVVTCSGRNKSFESIEFNCVADGHSADRHGSANAVAECGTAATAVETCRAAQPQACTRFQPLHSTVG
jgi:hypothetical protein